MVTNYISLEDMRRVIKLRSFFLHMGNELHQHVNEYHFIEVFIKKLIYNLLLSILITQILFTLINIYKIKPRMS